MYCTGTDQEITSDGDLELVSQAGESSFLPEEIKVSVSFQEGKKEES